MSNTKTWHPPSIIRIIILMLFIISANIFDGCSTLEILRRGGVELNPYACMAISNGHNSFLIWKIALITLCVLILAFLSRYFRAASIALHFVTLIFAALTVLHFYILGIS